MPGARGTSHAWPAASAPRPPPDLPPLRLPLDHASDGALSTSLDAFPTRSPLLPRPVSQPSWGAPHAVSPARSVFSDTNNGTDAPSFSLAWSREPSPDPRTRSAAAGSLAASDQRTQLVVHNLPFSARWQDIKDLFRRAGTVLRADVHLLPDGRGSGSGTVLFATPEDAARAVDMLHGYMWQGRVLDVWHEGSEHALPAPGVPPPLHWPPAPGVPPWALPVGAPAAPPLPAAPNLPYPGRVLFVGNLPFHCQWQDLKDLFRAAGNIQRADVALNGDGRSRGFGTVLFASPADAQNAVRLFHGYEYGRRTLKVHFDRLALFRPTTTATLPADPSEYTAAFTETPVPQAVREEPSTPPHTRPPAATAAHPGRITMPGPSAPGAPVGMPGGLMTPTAAALGYPMTPGPGFMLGQVPETPQFLPHFLSPGIGHFGSPVCTGRMTPGSFTPLVNPAPGAPPVDYMSAVSGPSFAQTPLPYYDIGYMHMFTPLGPLPPTPHWSQPVRAPPPQVPVDEAEPAPPSPSRAAQADMQDTTAQLASAIARMSVRGTARSESKARMSPERSTAKIALTKLRENLATPAPPIGRRTPSKDDDARPSAPLPETTDPVE